MLRRLLREGGMLGSSAKKKMAKAVFSEALDSFEEKKCTHIYTDTHFDTCECKKAKQGSVRRASFLLGRAPSPSSFLLGRAPSLPRRKLAGEGALPRRKLESEGALRRSKLGSEGALPRRALKGEGSFTP